MRWARYDANGRPAYGIVDGEELIEVEGDPFAGYRTTATRRRLAAVKLLVPIEPRTFYCAGLNYPEHVIEAARMRGEEPNLPQAADIGYRANNALVAAGEAIVIPADASERVQYEGELVAVIGKKVKHLSEADALSCVLGWTIGNDVSERRWQAGDRTLWRAKNTDTFKPMGPWIETDFDLGGGRDDDPRQWRRKDPLQDWQHDLRAGRVHQPDVAIPDPLSRRCRLDGHRRCDGKPEARRRLRDRDHRHRHPLEPGGARRPLNRRPVSCGRRIRLRRRRSNNSIGRSIERLGGPRAGCGREVRPKFTAFADGGGGREKRSRAW